MDRGGRACPSHGRRRDRASRAELNRCWRASSGLRARSVASSPGEHDLRTPLASLNRVELALRTPRSEHELRNAVCAADNRPLASLARTCSCSPSDDDALRLDPELLAERCCAGAGALLLVSRCGAVVEVAARPVSPPSPIAPGRAALDNLVTTRCVRIRPSPRGGRRRLRAPAVRDEGPSLARICPAFERLAALRRTLGGAAGLAYIVEAIAAPMAARFRW